MTEGFEQSTLNALRRSQEVAQRAADWHQANQRRLDELVENASEPARRVNAWLEAHQDQIAAVARRLQEFDRLLKDIEEQWDGAGLGYLVSPLDAGEHLFLSLHAEPGNSDELFAFLEAAMADNEFVDAVCSALDSAAVLSDVPRRHLQHGMRHIGQRDVFNAWPPLIIGLEGAFADVAIAEGLAVRVDNHVYLADQGGHALSKKIGSVERLVKDLGHDETTDFGDFLLRKVYGGEGNPFRHGIAQDGIRDRAVCLAVAVIGWLDAFVAPESLELLSSAIWRELARREDEESADLDG